VLEPACSDQNQAGQRASYGRALLAQSHAGGPQAQHQALAGEAHVGHVQADQLGTAEGGTEANQQQRPIAEPDQRLHARARLGERRTAPIYADDRVQAQLARVDVLAGERAAEPGREVRGS
jgi:hypothetical protein